MTRQQQWAKSAHEAVTGVSRNGDAQMKKKFKTLCMKTPGLIQQAGLVQALAFVVARDANTGAKYVDLVAAALQRDRAGLLRQAREAALDEYIVLTQDVTAVAGWLRRFAQIELAEVEESSDG